MIINSSSNTQPDRNAIAVPLNGTANDLEIIARAALDLRVGLTASEQEWAHARTRLIQFAGILRRWQCQADHEGDASWPKAA